MNALIQFLHPLRQAATAFFKHDVTLRRGDKGVQLVLEQKKPAPPRAKAGSDDKDKARRRDAEELALMRQQLGALLSEVPETRRTLLALVAVEQALNKKGLRALRKLPLAVLRRGLDQFEGLVTNWSPVGLATLRSKMAVLILEREGEDADDDGDAYHTAAVMDDADDGADVDSAPVPLEAADEAAADEAAALAAAYAALGDFTPATVEFQPELGSPSARAVSQPMPLDEPLGEIRLRELHR